MSEKINNKQPNILKLRVDNDPILHEKCHQLSEDEILSKSIQDFIDDMKYTCDKNSYGVGLSANQLGKLLSISLIAIKPTPARPNLDIFDNVCINTEVIETFGNKIPKWEGCTSIRDENGDPLMALVPRFEKVRIKYYDRSAKIHDEILDGFIAHVVQHETDHLNGVMFTDLIDESSLITYQEYKDSVINASK